MKKITLFSAFIAFAQIASASQILSTYTFQNKDGTTYERVYSGFSEDGFNRAQKTCYLESALGVCPLIDQAQGAADMQYGQGGHGTFEVKSCKIEGEIVKLKYDRINDYDGRIADIELDIKPCTGR